MRLYRRIYEDDGDPRHGSANGYQNLHCRCEDCTAAFTEACRERKARRATHPAIPHGTENGYSNYGCRCDQCRAAHTANARVRRAA